MNELLKSKTDHLLELYKQVNKDYRWKNSSNMNNLIALSYSMRGKAYSRHEIDRVNAYIKKNTGPFSCYRQKSILFSALLVLNYQNPESKFDLLLDYEDKLKEIGFKSYTYRPVTAYTLMLTSEGHRVDEVLSKAYDIFTEMRKNHPWLTSGDDYPLSILLAGSNKKVSELMGEIEDLYKELNEAGFSKSNGLQFLSHVLSLSKEGNKEKAYRCRKLYDYFIENKLRIYSSNYGSLGLLTLLEEQSDKAARDVKDISKYLGEDRNFRWLGRETLFLTATSLVTFMMLDKMKNGSDLVHTNAFVTMEALMAAQNAAMLGATCAVVGATASGS